MHITHVVIGGGSSGCVIASRLSEDTQNQVLLIEAGQDTPPSRIPADISDSYPGYAAANPHYQWNKLRAELCAGQIASSYEQARVMGGGSSINGQVATRGAPSDYDTWEKMGAAGWNWSSVLPYFRKLECDLDFRDHLHGADGPIAVRRISSDAWDGFSHAIAQSLARRGYVYEADMNGADFRDGYSPIPITNLSGCRVSSAIGYLSDSVRRRPNLKILTETIAERLLFEGTRISGIEIFGFGKRRAVKARCVVVSAGSIHSPALLMRSGVGPGQHLQEIGIPVIVDLPGVGENLQEHPAITISGYIARHARMNLVTRRHNNIYLRYSSGIADCGTTDMLMNFICRSGWHSIGYRLATIQTYILNPFSRGQVRLSAPDAHAEPDVMFRLLSDRRDFLRLVDAVPRMMSVFQAPDVSACTSNVFLSSHSDRVRRIGRRSFRNRLITVALANLLDASGTLRSFVIDQLISSSPPLRELLRDDAAMEAHVRGAVTGVWHPVGTCRMGSVHDPRAVTDSLGRVRGVIGLHIADASIMPEIPRANTNLPAMMIGEKIADAMRRGYGH